jgi:hypothetical protein
MSAFTSSPSEESTGLLHVKRTGLHIGGRCRPAASGATFRMVEDPATGAFNVDHRGNGKAEADARSEVSYGWSPPKPPTWGELVTSSESAECTKALPGGAENKDETERQKL